MRGELYALGYRRMRSGKARRMGSDEQEFPSQQQERPGHEGEMEPEPHDEMRGYKGSGKLEGKVALVTGGDSGIGRAVCAAFAKEGADVAIAYLSEDEDAEHTKGLVEAEGQRAITIKCDLQREEECRRVIEETVSELGALINHAGTQTPVDSPEEMTTEQWDGTFKTNVYSYFWTTKAALEHLGEGGAIINTGSVNGLRGNKSVEERTKYDLWYVENWSPVLDFKIMLKTIAILFIDKQAY